MVENERARFVLQVKPNAKQNQLLGFKAGVLHLRIAAPPREGKANEALIKFLSERLGVSKSRISLEKGLTGKTKTITIQGLSQSQAMKQLEFLSG